MYRTIESGPIEVRSGQVRPTETIQHQIPVNNSRRSRRLAPVFLALSSIPTLLSGCSEQTPNNKIQIAPKYIVEKKPYEKNSNQYKCDELEVDITSPDSSPNPLDFRTIVTRKTLASEKLPVFSPPTKQLNQRKSIHRYASPGTVTFIAKPTLYMFGLEIHLQDQVTQFDIKCNR